MNNKYNRAEQSMNNVEEIVGGFEEFESRWEDLEKYRDDFDVYAKNKYLKIVNFIDNFIKNKSLISCQSCLRNGVSLSYFDNCFLYQGKHCETTGLNSFIEKDNKKRTFSIRGENNKILAKLEIKIDPILERGLMI